MGVRPVTLLERGWRLVRACRTCAPWPEGQDSVQVVGADALTLDGAPAGREASSWCSWTRRSTPTSSRKAVAVALAGGGAGGLIYLEADREFSPEDFTGEPLTRLRHGRAGSVHYRLFQRAEARLHCARIDRRRPEGARLTS